LDEHLKRLTQASSEFESIFGREPTPGDVLSYEHVAAVCSPEFNASRFLRFISAWERRLPDLVCPIKFERGRLFKREIDAQDCNWCEDTDIQAQGIWLRIEHEFRWYESGKPAMPLADPPLESMPTIPAFVFLGVMQSWADALGFLRTAHTCRPVTKQELRRAKQELRRAAVTVVRDSGGNPTEIGFRRLSLTAGLGHHR